MSLPWWAWGIIAVIVGGGSALALDIHDADVRAEAILVDSLQVVHRSETSLRDSLARNSKAMHQDTVVLTRWRTAYTTLHDTVLKNVHDTIAVIQFVHTADSTISACSQLVSDCQARARILSEQVAAVSAERDVYKRETPTFLMKHEVAACSVTGVAGLVTGAIIGKHF